MLKDVLKIAAGVAVFNLVRGFLPAGIKQYLS